MMSLMSPPAVSNRLAFRASHFRIREAILARTVQQLVFQMFSRRSEVRIHRHGLDGPQYALQPFYFNTLELVEALESLRFDEERELCPD
jgi:hypothetical protein